MKVERKAKDYQISIDVPKENSRRVSERKGAVERGLFPRLIAGLDVYDDRPLKRQIC